MAGRQTSCEQDESALDAVSCAPDDAGADQERHGVHTLPGGGQVSRTEREESGTARDAGAGITRGASRWLARGAFAAAAAAIVLFLVGAGVGGLVLIAEALVATGLVAAFGYWFLVNRGLFRWISLAICVIVPVIVFTTFIVAGHVLEMVISLAIWVVVVLLARAALAADIEDPAMPTRDVPAPVKPFLIMNPRSGGGKVVRFGLKEKAEALGAEVVLLEGPADIDVAQLARDAVASGADLIGVAGGDGTQALVAGVAAEHDIPFLVISAGTRNHFALDLGLDREDPASCLQGLTDGQEMRIDLGDINGRTFVNNASFGAYADIVQSPEYRADKAKTALDMLPDLMMGRRGSRLAVRAGDLRIEQPQAVLVSNNPYGNGDLAGAGRRTRIDRGTLGVIGVSVSSARQAMGLLRRTHRHGLQAGTAGEVIIDSDEPTIPVGVDGEALVMSTPVTCRCEPGKLRVRVPRSRPGVPKPKPALNWVRLRE
jgi:diacylglycerol kinase family enzyme